ncbi:DUF3048 domain-containing protein [Thalassobacillus devorans]|uniref:DUF3048 domain-containing protein n=1 Tax=Thalassobacillus devorans TaxID=279813 RepID=UPI00048D1413|nr:DUF3048 domain-containing protein [Thalassobacillus devorans]
MNKYVMMLLLLLPLLLAACTSDETEGKEPADAPEKETRDPGNYGKEKPEENTYTNVYPFTGEPTNDTVDHRAIAVMVNNHSKARPQTGLSQADIVYELLAEGEITRFLAVFHSNIPDEIGPVRSARPYYFKLAKAHDAIYTYHGAAKFIDDQIRNDGHDYLNGAVYDNDGKLFRRDNTRKAPHNSYLLTDGIPAVIEQKGYTASHQIEPYFYTDENSKKTQNGKDVTDVKIVYSNRFGVTVAYEYDEDKERYIRYNDGKQTVEREGQTPIELDNVLIIETSHRVIDSAGRREIDLNTGGKGYLLQKGKLHEVTWKNDSGRIVPYQGKEKLGLVPGQTWVNVIPADPGLERSVSYR